MKTPDYVEMMSQAMPEKDVYAVLDIAKKVIEVMKYRPLISDEAFVKLTPEERYKELMTPRICSFKLTDDLSCIFIRFVDDETPLANVLFFPIEAIWSFLDTARNYFNTPETTLSEEEIEELAFGNAVNMTCLMLRNIYPRVMATMHTITDETINEWYRQQHEIYREVCARQGTFVPSNEPVIKKVRQNIIKGYGKEVGGVWQSEKKRFENYQKLRLAEEYEKLYPHWETISLLFRSNKEWLGYAKIGGFEDIPDDLLDEMKGSHHRGMSLKALEHAARRIGMINLDCADQDILEKRKNGVQATGFSDTTLYKYLDEGKKVLEFVRAQPQIETTPPEVLQLAE